MRILRSVAASIALAAAFSGCLAERAASQDVLPRWEGFYIGLNAGGGISNTGTVELLAESVTPVNFGDAVTPSRGTIGEVGDERFGFFGAQLGFSRQAGRLVFGAEADIQASSLDDVLEGSFSNPAGTFPIDGRAKLGIDWFGTLRAKLGLALGTQWLAYATGGLAFGRAEYHLHAFEVGGGRIFEARLDDTVRTGYVVGAGLEYAINATYSLKLEYQYIDLGKLEGVAPVTDIFSGLAVGDTARTSPVDLDLQTIRVGLNLKLGGHERRAEATLK